MDRLADPTDDLLRLLVDQSATPLAVVDRGGRIVRVNDALRRLVSRHCDLSPGAALRNIFSHEPADEIWDELAPVLQGRRSPRRFLSALRGKSDVAVQPVEVLPIPLRETDGDVSGAVLHLSDIAVQRKLEAQLTQSQSLQAVGQLAGGIAHDFNNLLTAMLGAADEALERGQSDPDTIADLRQIRASGERGAALVRHLLAFGRQQALHPRAVPINGAITDLTAILRRLLGSSVQLKLELEEPDRSVRVDPTQLDQVLINLAVNARDAMPGGGDLTLRTGHMNLFRALVRGEETIPPGRYVMVEVQDTGTGIPPDILARIFDPFFSTRRDRGGTGLGLSTVHGIIRQSDGFLAVDSVVGRGTRFRIYLPRYDGEEVSIPRVPMQRLGKAAGQDVPAANGKAVLLVDDEDGIRRVATRALTRRGWRVLSAASGEAALALLADPAEHSALCAIVSDMTMPGMDGLALVQAVRAMRPGLPALLVSGYAEEAVRRDFDGQDVAFLPKPYTFPALVAAVEACALRHGAVSRQPSEVGAG